MSNVATIDQAKAEKTNRQSLIAKMAERLNMDADVFAATVRSTVMPSNHTNEQFAALMMVAAEYDLNPVVKEIYAFPAKGGGIVPIVSIDGWVNLVNSHPACDGFEFEFEHDGDKKLISCTCRMYRKDRAKPVTVTEYLSECKRSTEPWKMEHRMLRHKAMIQAARYAFGFSGIYDEDEGAKIADAGMMKDVTPPPSPPAPPAPPKAKEPKIIPPAPDEPTEPLPDNIGDVVQDVCERLAVCTDFETLNEIWDAEAEPYFDLITDDMQDALEAAKERGKDHIAQHMAPVN